MKLALDLIFPKDLVRQPLIYQLCKEVPVSFNIRRAKVNETAGEIVLELEGSQAELQKAVEWLNNKGVKVDPVTHDALES